MTTPASTTSDHQGRNPTTMEVGTATIPDRGTQVSIRAGRSRIEHVIPPAGEKYAFDVRRWDHEIVVYASRTGRSVRVWIDGVETKIPKKPGSTLDGPE